MEGTGSASAVNGLLNSERATATASASATSPELPIQSTGHEQATLRSSEDTTTHPAESVKEYAGPAPVVLPLSQNSARTESITSQAEALLALPPPPSYDVHVHDLSVAVPPFRAYIPTPIPIPIPQAVTNLVRKRGSRDAGAPGEDSDGLIVRNVTATIRSGEMCALIGGSGSGKTTLLHAIASRLENLPIASGSVVITPAGGAQSGNNPVGGQGKFKGLSKVLGFVRQNDFLLPHLTVRETLTYAAKLRLPSSVDAKTRRLIIEQTIQELGLAEAADTIVGGAGRKGISGGERRRLSIGCVLVSFPSVLVLDEVTTGLDSYTAYQLLETLGRLAQRGRTIILSLHQPRSDAFGLFSRILLLSHGSVVYSGPTLRCLPYFANLGYEPETQTNPLDFLIDVSSIDTRDADAESESRTRLAKLQRTWREAPVRDEATPHAPEKLDGTTEQQQTSIVQETTSGKRPGVLAQTVILLPRSTKNMLRAYPELIGHILQAAVTGVVVGITFFNLRGSPSDIQSLKTLAFQLGPVYCYLSQVVWTFKWCTTLIVYDRERQDNLYNPAAWLFSEFVAWLPVNIVAPVILAIITYFISNLRKDDLAYSLGVYVVNIVLVQLCYVSWALFAASIERSFARASLLGNALSIFFILSPGFFIVNVPGWIRWFRWISPFFFSFRIILISQFRNRQFSCEGVIGEANTAQCVGNNALRSLLVSPDEPLWPLFLGNVGFIVIVLALSLLLLTVWKPGGVRHAQRVASGPKGKELTSAEIDLARAKVFVQAENVKLTFVRRLFPSWKKVEVPILTNINAVFPPGEVTVIMGPSGSGKSTFLKMISGRPLTAGLLSSFVPSGKITLNGVTVSPKTRHVCAFVEQDDDYHLPALTVRETLRFAATIKLPANVSRKRKLARAEEVLKMLGLRDCADGVVGGELLKGISGGEKRRLSLACEMINDPAVLIVDEPTSGLDANTARNVMEALRDIARSGRTVIASLHQPRSDIYNMADNYVILAKRGNVIFQGPRDALIPHFALAGHACPPLYNPSDFSMDLVSVDVRGKRRQQETQGRVNSLIAHWQAHEGKIAEMQESTRAPSDSVALDARQENTPIWIALPVVLGRSWRNTWRQSDLFWTRFVQAPILAVCFFIFFLRLPHGPTGGQTRIGLVAECTSAISFVGFLNLAALYPQEKTVFFHDYRGAGGRYSSATFVAAFSLFAFIPEFLSALIFAAIMNVATGMQTNARIYFEFAVAIWAQLNFGESIGIAFASFFSTMGLSVSLVSTFLTFAGFASGVFSASIAKFLSDIAYAFPMKYAAHIMLQNEMTGLSFDCSQASIQSGECTAANGQQVLDLFGYSGSTAKLTGIMVAITLAYRVAAWAILAMRMKYL